MNKNIIIRDCNSLNRLWDLDYNHAIIINAGDDTRLQRPDNRKAVVNISFALRKFPIRLQRLPIKTHWFNSSVIMDFLQNFIITIQSSQNQNGTVQPPIGTSIRI